MLRIGRSTLRRLALRGIVPCIELGPRTLRFDEEALDRWRASFFPSGQSDPFFEMNMSKDGGRRDEEEGSIDLPSVPGFKDLPRRILRCTRSQNHPEHRNDKPKASRGDGSSVPTLGPVAQDAAKKFAKTLRGHAGGDKDH